MRGLLSLLLLLWAVAAGGQVDPVARIAVTPETVRVGEAVSLRVTVLVPTWFPQPPEYPDFEVVNAITRLPPDSSFPTSERIDGESWSGIVREYRVYPLVAGDYRIDGASVRVTYANPGADPVVRELALPPVVFRGIVPAGAEGLDPYLAGRDLQLSVAVRGAEGQLAVGDAVVLTYTAALDGLPSMFLPPLAPALDTMVEAGRVSVYADAPRYDDEGGLATRSERLTLLFQAGGVYSVPAVAIDYWDTQAGKLRTARSQALQLSVAGPAVVTDDAAEAVDSAVRWWPALAVGALLLLSAVAAPAALRRAQLCLAAWRASEPRAFRDLRRALRAGSEAQQYSALQRWLSRLEPALAPRAFAYRYGDAALQDAIEALSAHCFGGRGPAPQPGQLWQALAQARRRYHRARRRRRSGAIVPLNP